MNPLLYKEHFNPHAQNAEEVFGYEDWPMLEVDYTPPDPYLAGYAKNKGEPADVVSYVEWLIGRLHGLYKFRDDATVEDYLEENPDLYNLLVEVHNKVQEYFGPETPVALDVLREPDARRSGRLFVLIITALSPKEAVGRLNKLDREWWFGVLSEARGKLTIDIDSG